MSRLLVGAAICFEKNSSAKEIFKLIPARRPIPVKNYLEPLSLI